jgi:prevent-host-death family protein
MGSEKAPVSSTELSERAEELVRNVHDTGEAVVVLQGGEPAAVLIGVRETYLPSSDIDDDD